MRHIISTILAIVSLSLLTSCEMFEQGFKKHQLIIDSSASCSYEAQEFTIAYSVDPKFSDQNIVVTATANAEWITSIDTSTPNEIRLTVEENIDLQLKYLNLPKAERKQRVLEILRLVNMSHRAKHYPQQLSGGQQQRVAIARAVVGKPKLVLADEPTGNLDSKHGKEIMELLSELNAEGTTIVMVTHSQRDAAFAHRTINLLDGEVVNELAI